MLPLLYHAAPRQETLLPESFILFKALEVLSHSPEQLPIF